MEEQHYNEQDITELNANTKMEIHVYHHNKQACFFLGDVYCTLCVAYRH